MKKLTFLLFLSSFIFLLSFFSLPLIKPAYAASACGTFVQSPAVPPNWNTKTGSKSIFINDPKMGDGRYDFQIIKGGNNLVGNNFDVSGRSGVTIQNGAIGLAINLAGLPGGPGTAGTYTVLITFIGVGGPFDVCQGDFVVELFSELKCTVELFPDKGTRYGPSEVIGLRGEFKINNLDGSTTPYVGGYFVRLENSSGTTVSGPFGGSTIATGYYENSSLSTPGAIPGIQTWTIYAYKDAAENSKLCETNLYVSPTGGESVATPSPGVGSGKNPCGAFCETALGNIGINPQEFASSILKIGVMIAGGIALIFMVIGAIRVLTSSGDQQKLSGGRDMIVAALAGLLFLIFSVLILGFAGIEIVGIPSFGRTPGP